MCLCAAGSGEGDAGPAAGGDGGIYAGGDRQDEAAADGDGYDQGAAAGGLCGSLRAAVLAAADRAEDRDLLKDDVQWLIDAAVDGAYTYDDRFTVRVVGVDAQCGGGAEPALCPAAD